MKKLVHSICLIFGTCVGAGLVALPMLAVHLGIGLSAIIIAAMVYIAWRSSVMTVDLNALHQTPSSIVQLSEVYSGKKAFGITLASFYLLSFSLLTVYFSCVSDTVNTFCHFGKTTGILLWGCGLFGVLSLETRIFSRLNTIFVGLLMIVIVVAIFQTCMGGAYAVVKSSCKPKDLWAFLPVIFTSFGVQNVCHTIYGYLDGDKRKIRLAFLIGILLPAVVYIAWIACVLQTIASNDAAFYQRLQAHEVSVGELIVFLCDCSHYKSLGLFLKLLTLLAVITSAVGIAIGLLQSVKELLSDRLARLLVCIVPVIINLTISDVFLKILSFGGMVATVFVFFMPYYLLKKQKQPLNVGEHICFLFGIMVVLCELRQLL